MREELSNEVAASINEFGPKMYDDFDQASVSEALLVVQNLIIAFQWRILVPSASVPPSTGKPGLWRRKSGVGAVDAQGNLLAHPMVNRLVKFIIGLC